MNEPIPLLLLYITDDCALCDKAIAILAAARAPDFATACIDDDACLVERYGVRVPVLHDVNRSLDLDWPFDATRVQRFLGAS